MSMKNFSDTIGNRTRDLPVCSAVPQPTAPPRTSPPSSTKLKISGTIPLLSYVSIACGLIKDRSKFVFDSAVILEKLLSCECRFKIVQDRGTGFNI
jgi:hypothetical protein